MYTSLKLSKLLQENGFEGKSEKYHIPLTKGYTIGNKPEKTIDDKPFFNAYDILNDLCVKYAKEMFGKEGYSSDIFYFCNKCNERIKKLTPVCHNDANCWKDHEEQIQKEIGIKKIKPMHIILSLIIDNKQDLAELYLFENCLFNPKNK